MAISYVIVSQARVGSIPQCFQIIHTKVTWLVFPNCPQGQHEVSFPRVGWSLDSGELYTCPSVLMTLVNSKTGIL